MKISLVVIGKIKKGIFQDLYQLYERRLRFPLILKELEVREAVSDVMRMQAEGVQILKLISPESYVIVLDEKGIQLTSQGFADFYASLQAKSLKEVIFVIGGAFGLSEAVRARANTSLAFGALTWPHLMVRSLLAEQLYRAQQILSGHPYHKE